jgi:hypothetical protein
VAALGREVAVEDYARALTGAASAEALLTIGQESLRGVHLCGLPAPVAPEVRDDVEAFARELAERGGGGLGWS